MAKLVVILFCTTGTSRLTKSSTYTDFEEFKKYSIYCILVIAGTKIRFCKKRKCPRHPLFRRRWEENHLLTLAVNKNLFVADLMNIKTTPSKFLL
jgi:hypothetical protein